MIKESIFWGCNVDSTQIRGFQVGPIPGRSTLHQREVRLVFSFFIFSYFKKKVRLVSSEEKVIFSFWHFNFSGEVGPSQLWHCCRFSLLHLLNQNNPRHSMCHILFSQTLISLPLLPPPLPPPSFPPLYSLHLYSIASPAILVCESFSKLYLS